MASALVLVEVLCGDAPPSKRGVSGEQGYRGNILYGVCVRI